MAGLESEAEPRIWLQIDKNGKACPPQTAVIHSYGFNLPTSLAFCWYTARVISIIVITNVMVSRM